MQLPMKLLYDVARGSQTCQAMDFSGSPHMIYGSDTIPKLAGWKFFHSGVERGFVCNFSADTFDLSLSSVFSGNWQFEQYFADTNFVVTGLSSVNKLSGNSANNILVNPFSITQVTLPVTSGFSLPELQATDGLWMFPNPARSQLTIRTMHTMNGADVIVFNMKGQEVKRISFVNGNQIRIPIDNLASGTYGVTITNVNKLVSGKFIVD